MKENLLHKEQGFTLIELLIVLTILSLVTAITVPLLGNKTDARKLKSSIIQLVTKMRLAKSEAITKGKETLFSINLETRRYWLKENAQYKLPPELSMTLFSAQEERVNTSTGRIRFFPDGTSTGGKLILKQADQTYVVTVDWLSGAVRLQ